MTINQSLTLLHLVNCA